MSLKVGRYGVHIPIFQAVLPTVLHLPVEHTRPPTRDMALLADVSHTSHAFTRKAKVKSRREKGPGQEEFIRRNSLVENSRRLSLAILGTFNSQELTPAKPALSRILYGKVRRRHPPRASYSRGAWVSQQAATTQDLEVGWLARWPSTHYRGVQGISAPGCAPTPRRSWASRFSTLLRPTDQGIASSPGPR